MQFSININQKVIYDLGLDISFEAAAVMDCMQKKTSVSTFQKRAVKEGDKLYFEFTHSLIVDNLPMIFSNVKGSQKNKVIRLTNELENAKLIEKHPYPQKVKKSLYCFTELADKLIEQTAKTDKQLSSNRDSKTDSLSSNRDSHCHQIVTVNGDSLSSNRDRSIITVKEVLNQEVCESTHAQIFSELKNEEKKDPTPAPQPPAPIAFNPKAKKVYESHLQIYDDLMMLWKIDELRLNTLKATIDPLGINDNTPDKKIAFAEHVKSIYCASIKLNTPFAISPVDVHDKVIQKIGYSKDEIKALKPIKAQVVTSQKIVAKKQSNKLDEMIALAYCNHLVQGGFKTITDCMNGGTTAKRLAMKAMNDIEGTKIYLSEKKIAYECV